MTPSADQFATVAPHVLSVWKELGVNFHGITPDVLEHAISTRAQLLPIEQKLEDPYGRANENRREADSDAMNVLLKLNRFVKTTGDADLLSAFQFLADWTHAHHRGAHVVQPTEGVVPANPVASMATK
jgi:hypothetical protein